jgi:hypothetical protein
MLEAMDPPWVGLEVCLVSAFLFPVALCPVLFSVALGFHLILKKAEKELLLLIRLTNIAIWSFYILGRGDSKVARVAAAIVPSNVPLDLYWRLL